MINQKQQRLNELNDQYINNISEIEEHYNPPFSNEDYATAWDYLEEILFTSHPEITRVFYEYKRDIPDNQAEIKFTNIAITYLLNGNEVTITLSPTHNK